MQGDALSKLVSACPSQIYHTMYFEMKSITEGSPVLQIQEKLSWIESIKCYLNIGEELDKKEENKKL